MLKYYIIQFIVVLIVSILFNGTYLLVYKTNDIYLTYTYLYIGLLASSNVLWIHQLINFLTYNKINKTLLITGLILSLISFYLVRKQYYIGENQLLKRLITKYSTTNFEISTFLKKNQVLNRELENLLNDMIVNNINNKEKILNILNKN